MTDEANEATGSIEPANPPERGGAHPKPCTPDDLIELVRAIKFAHTEMSQRNVHNEISVAMANSDPSYEFLKDVKLNDVKKVWKKALKGAPDATKPVQKREPAAPKNMAATVTDDEPPSIVPAEGIIKFYTVGDGSVKTLAENYTKHHAEAAVAASQQQNADAEKEKGKYTHFFLDVPADMSGERPHQALINYQENHKSGKGKNKSFSKKGGKSSTKSSSGDDDRDIFKIQLAALPPGMEDIPMPMLLYNADRSAKTFLHPPSSDDDNDDDGGYIKIRKMITESGTSGALGATGGQKVS